LLFKKKPDISLNFWTCLDKLGCRLKIYMFHIGSGTLRPTRYTNSNNTYAVNGLNH